MYTSIMYDNVQKGFDSGQPQTPDYTGGCINRLIPVLCKTSNTLVLILYIISISGILAPFLFMIYFNLRQSAESKKYKLGK
jgi:hypothetical protein